MHEVVVRAEDVNGSSMYAKNEFYILPKRAVLYASKNITGNDKYTKVRIKDMHMEEGVTETAGIISTPEIKVVGVEEYIMNVMYGLIKGDFKDRKYKEAYKAIAIAIYTQLLYEIQKNKEEGEEVDVIVNGYTEKQKYYIPYEETGWGGILLGVKKRIKEAVEEIKVEIGNKKYIKAFWFEKIKEKGEFEREVEIGGEGVKWPYVNTHVFRYVKGKGGENAIIQSAMNEIGKGYSYLKETVCNEADVEVKGGAKPGTKIGMSVWGAMFLSEHNFKADLILRKFYHWAPVYLAKLEIEQGGKMVYSREWGKAKMEGGRVLREVKQEAGKGVENDKGARIKLYFSDKINGSSLIVRLKSERNPLGELLLGGYEDKESEKYLEVKEGNIMDFQLEGLVEKEDKNKLVTVAVNCIDKYNGSMLDEKAESVALGGEIIGEAEGYEYSILGSDESNKFSIIVVKEREVEKQGEEYKNVEKEEVKAGENVERSLPKIEIDIDLSKLLKMINIDLSHVDLLSILKGLKIDIGCMREEEREKLRDVKFPEIDKLKGMLGDDLKGFIRDELKIDVGCVDFKGLSVKELFKIPEISISIPGISVPEINIPRPDLKGVKWDIDMSKFGIAFFPDSLQGGDAWGLVAGLFQRSLSFRGIEAPKIYIPPMKQDLPIDEWVKQIMDTSVCEVAGGAAKGIMRKIEEELRKGKKDKKVNLKVVAQGGQENYQIKIC